MPDDVREAYIRRVAEASEGPVQLAFQGGEPTLAELEFFRRAVGITQEEAGLCEIRWALQTNGLLLDDEW